MTADRKKDLARYVRLRVRLEKLGQEVSALREKLAKRCEHPDEFVCENSQDRDNGYGRWWKHTYQRCMICRAERHHGNWIAESDLSRD